MTKPNVTLLRDLVMIQAAELQLSKSEGGIIVPGELDKMAPKRATVIAAGPGTFNKKGDFVPTSVKPGDEILYMQTNVISAKIEGKDYYIIPSSEVLLKLSTGDTSIESKDLTYFKEKITTRLIKKLTDLGLTRLDDMTAPVDVFTVPMADGSEGEIIPLSARSFIISEKSLNDPFSPPEGTVAFSMWQVVERVPGQLTGDYVARFAFSDRADIKKA